MTLRVDDVDRMVADKSLRACKRTPVKLSEISPAFSPANASDMVVVLY